MSEHKLIGGKLVKESEGVVARCVCGWVSGGHFSGFSASAAMMEHQDEHSGPNASPASDSPESAHSLKLAEQALARQHVPIETEIEHLADDLVAAGEIDAALSPASANEGSQ